MKYFSLISAFVLLFLVACQDRPDLPDVPSGAQTYSLLGDTLYTPELDSDVRAEYLENLEEAMNNYRFDPEDPKNIIWLGRRTAYLGEYREAIGIFTEGTFKHSEDPRMYRHRGHRFLTLRLFDKAADDFTKAAELFRRMDDIVEPDGLPNEEGIPTSTLKSNVWYHHGLVEYLRGDYEKAIALYENALDLDLTDDMRIATLNWYYAALKRSGDTEGEEKAINDITPEIELIENDVYLNLLLLYKGVYDEEDLMDTGSDDLINATLSYGVGNWHYMNGREDRAFEIWNRIIEEGNWPAFGYIAAEAELSAIEY